MAFELLIGLTVNDETMYQQYREGMFPILQTYGGGFSSDFRVSDVLRPESNQAINRVFTVYFRDEQASKDFFANEAYLSVKKQFYENSVDDESVIVIASYQVDRNTTA